MKIRNLFLFISFLITYTSTEGKIAINLMFISISIISIFKDSSSTLFTKDICPGRSATIECTSTASTSFTPIVVEALQGISTVESDLCEYK